VLERIKYDLGAIGICYLDFWLAWRGTAMPVLAGRVWEVEIAGPGGVWTVLGSKRVRPAL